MFFKFNAKGLHGFPLFFFLLFTSLGDLLVNCGFSALIVWGLPWLTFSWPLVIAFAAIISVLNGIFGHKA